MNQATKPKSTLATGQMKRKVVIVGGGISGLTTGIYLLDNGYDVHIYEKHSVPGGACTGWVRDGQYIDGCAHWIIGTNPKSPFYPLWEHIGAISPSTHVYDTTELTSFDIDGELFPFSSNIAELRKNLLEISKEDRRLINSFIRTILDYTHIRIPVRKPLERMNLLELTAFGLCMLRIAVPYIYYRKVSVKEYAAKFKNKEIGDMLIRFMGEQYNMHSLFYVLANFCANNAGVIEGGSLKLSLRVAKRFKDLGGNLHLSAPVAKVRMNKRKAEGIELEDGTFVEADYVVVSTDAYHAFEKLLPNVKMPHFFKERFEKNDDYLIRSAFQISFRTTKDMDSFPRMSDYKIPEVEFSGMRFSALSIRNHSFDKTLSRNGKTLLTVLMQTNEVSYDRLKSLSRKEYERQKREIAEFVKKVICEKMGMNEGEIEILDVATPLTYERYTNAHKGAYMSFTTTKRSKGLMTSSIVKGYRNLLLGGQWLMPPGGLPIALMIGKHAAINLCYLDHVRFRNKERIKVRGVPKPICA